MLVYQLREDVTKLECGVCARVCVVHLLVPSAKPDFPVLWMRLWAGNSPTAGQCRWQTDLFFLTGHCFWNCAQSSWECFLPQGRVVTGEASAVSLQVQPHCSGKLLGHWLTSGHHINTIYGFSPLREVVSSSCDNFQMKTWILEILTLNLS